MFFINSILSLSRFNKRLIGMLADTLFVGIAFWGAFLTRLDDISFLNSSSYWQAILVLVICTLILFSRMGLYRTILRYLSMHALMTIIFSCAASAILLVLLGYYLGIFVPRSIPIIYSTYLVLLSGGGRLLVRVGVSHYLSKQKTRVIIYGAGESGRQLLNLLRQGNDYHPVAFVDDDDKLFKTVMNGLTVFNNKSLTHLISKMRASKVLLAVPHATRLQRKKIINSLIELPVEVLSVPHLEDILNGSSSIGQLRDVLVEDLLGRDSVAVKPELLAVNIKSKIIMVTGAGGSIGSELCRQIVVQKPTSLILFELSEVALYQMEKELSELVIQQNLDVKIVPLLGSVQNFESIKKVLKSFKVQTLYHAAAYKHVPLVEYNLVEAVRNNVFGTYYTALAAIDAQVESFVLISSDKAVRPTNIMGVTKRMAELVLQSLDSENSKTRFCMVRFGNVLNSSGSVIPLFKKQISQGGIVTITHPDIIRYFMTIPEAAALVIQAGAMASGGDVFVLDMGKPIKIVDLATSLIKLSGLEVKSEENPWGDIELKYTGLRPGEKLFEELLVGDNVEKTAHKRIMAAKERFLPYSEYRTVLDELDKLCTTFNHEEIYNLLLSVPAGFSPTDGMGDLLWKKIRSNSLNY